MFFGFCTSEFSSAEVICQVEGDTIEDIICGFEMEDIVFDEAFADHRITVIEGDYVQLTQTSTYTVER
jgi:hypothetical protein